jgi:hypothetical protein
MSLRLFDKAEDRWPWAALEAEARRNPDQRWLDELAEAIHRGSQRQVVDPVQNTFRARRGGKTYRPVLYRCDTGADRSMTFKVLFVEDVSWQLREIPPDLHTLLTAIVMGTRFRYEVLNRFSTDLPAPGSSDAPQVCKEILEAIESIEAEAEARGTLEQHSLAALFTREERNEIDAMYVEWYRIREQLSGDLNSAAMEAVSRHLTRLIEINNDFMRLASRRYADMMAERTD